jgi:mandelate racemase
MALWDARARAAEMPLAVLLGGAVRPVPGYTSLPSMTAHAVVAEAAAAAEQGFAAMKLKRGGSDLASDLSVIRQVRGVIGVEAELMVDYNQSLTVD